LLYTLNGSCPLVSMFRIWRPRGRMVATLRLLPVQGGGGGSMQVFWTVHQTFSIVSSNSPLLDHGQYLAGVLPTKPMRSSPVEFKSSNVLLGGIARRALLTQPASRDLPPNACGTA
jgi:hypothetical protein